MKCTILAIFYSPYIDLYPFMNIIRLDNLEIRILFIYRTKKVNLLFYKSLILDHVGFILTLVISSRMNEIIKNHMLYYNFISNLVDINKYILHQFSK